MAQSGRLGMTDVQKGELWQRWRNGESITGSAVIDTILGNAGNDNITGDVGADVVFGDSGEIVVHPAAIALAGVGRGARHRQSTTPRERAPVSGFSSRRP